MEKLNDQTTSEYFRSTNKKANSLQQMLLRRIRIEIYETKSLDLIKDFISKSEKELHNDFDKMDTSEKDDGEYDENENTDNEEIDEPDIDEEDSDIGEEDSVSNIPEKDEKDEDGKSLMSASDTKGEVFETENHN